VPGGELGKRDIHVAAHEREEQHGEDVPVVNSNLLVSISEDVDLDQEDQEPNKEEEGNNKGKSKGKK
jgi:hypothetical protein